MTEFVVHCVHHPDLIIAAFESAPDGADTPEPDWWYYKKDLALGGGAIDPETGVREWYDPVSSERRASTIGPGVGANRNLRLTCPRPECVAMEFGYLKIVRALRAIAGSGVLRVSDRDLHRVIDQIG